MLEPSSFNQRIQAAASNSLASNAGRSKLSTEEFKLSDDNEESSSLSEKYKKNESGSHKPTSSGSNNTGHSGYNKTSGYSNNNHNNDSYRTSTYNTSDRSISTGSNSNSNGYNAPKPYSSNTSTNNNINTRSFGYSNNINNTSYSSSINNNSFDRWNSNTTGIESIELLKDQLSHQQRDYESLKQRFNELSRMRFSEPEERLEEHKKLSELRDQEAQRVIKSLQKEKAELLDQLQQLKLDLKQEKEIVNAIKDVKVVSKPSENEMAQVEEDFMNEIEKILKIYSSFSGLKITPTPTDPLHQWHCEFSSRSGHFNFQLTYESALNRYQYVPLSSGSIKDLPSFLASDILITSDQMQLFFWRLLDTLSKRKD